MTSFLEELQRRNVVRVAIAYAIVGWLLIEVAATMLPIFEAPEWILRVFSFLVILGFPVALVLAWAFEMTPEGVRSQTSVDRSRGSRPSSGRKLDFLIIAVLAIAVVLLVIDKLG